MRNPNNCTTCDYTKLNANREGHCYMLHDEPTDICMQHTGRKLSVHDLYRMNVNTHTIHNDKRKDKINV